MENVSDNKMPIPLIPSHIRIPKKGFVIAENSLVLADLAILISI